MRVFFSGPRIGWIRPGVSFGAEDFRPRSRTYQRQTSAEPITGSFVYVITDGHRVKVGSTVDPYRRVRELQTGNPRQLQLSFVGITPGPGTDIEIKAHDMLSSYGARIRGGQEWYDTTPEIAAAAVMGAAGQIRQTLNAISPSHVGQILQIAQAESIPKPVYKRLWFWIFCLVVWAACFALAHSIAG